MYDARSIESYDKEELMEGRTRCVKETFFYVTILLSQTHVHNHNTEQSLNIIHTPSYHLNVKKNRSLNIFFSCDFLIPRRFIMVLKRVFIYISRFNTEKLKYCFTR